MRKLLILLLLPLVVVITGCDIFGSSLDDTSPAYNFQTARAHFAIGSSIEATFANRSAQTLYLRYSGCLFTGLEQFVDSTWQSVPIPIGCTQEVKLPVPVSPGTRIQAGLAARTLEPAEIEPGTYRLVVHVSNTKEGNYVKTTSNWFKIIDAQGEWQSTE